MIILILIPTTTIIQCPIQIQMKGENTDSMHLVRGVHEVCKEPWKVLPESSPFTFTVRLLLSTLTWTAHFMMTIFCYLLRVYFTLNFNLGYFCTPWINSKVYNQPVSIWNLVSLSYGYM